MVGVAQTTVRGGDAPEPLELWADVCARAAADSGGSGVLDGVDSLQIVYCQSWQYDDPTGRLREDRAQREQSPWELYKRRYRQGSPERRRQRRHERESDGAGCQEKQCVGKTVRSL